VQTDDCLTAKNLYSRQQDQQKTRQELYLPLNTKRKTRKQELKYTHGQSRRQDTAGEGRENTKTGNKYTHDRQGVNILE